MTGKTAKLQQKIIQISSRQDISNTKDKDVSQKTYFVLFYKIKNFYHTTPHKITTTNHNKIKRNEGLNDK